MDEKLRERMASVDIWLRLLFIVLFGFFATIAAWLIWLVAAGQFLFVLLAGKRNEHLQEFAGALVAYVAQLFSYMVFRSDDKPFPFAPAPRAGQWPESSESNGPQQKAPAKEASVRKTAGTAKAEPESGDSPD